MLEQTREESIKDSSGGGRRQIGIKNRREGSGEGDEGHCRQAEDRLFTIYSGRSIYGNRCLISKQIVMTTYTLPIPIKETD